MSWFRVTPDKSGAVTIGRYKEQLVREVAFPLPELGEGGHYLAKLQRPHDEAPYPLASRVEGRELIWLVSLEDTSDPGEGLVEIRWDGPNGETWKSPQYAVRIAKGLADPKEAPEAWAGFLQQVNRDAGRAESAADRAEALEAGYTEALEKARAAAEDAWQGKVSAETSAKEAQADAQRAETAASTATQAAQAAQTAQGAAGQAAQAAQTAKEAAEQAQTGAQEAQTGAETAKTEAQAAKTAAEEAAKAAQGAASTAQTAANTAQGAAAAAENAQQSVETLASQVQGDADKVAADKAEAQKAAVDALGSQQEAQRQATAAQEAATSAGAAATSAAESKGQAETARTGAEAAQTKAEEAAQGVAADREQIGANKSGLEAAQQELTATKEQLAETKATLATTNEDLKKAQRAIQFQAELNKGQTWDFEEDTQTAYQRIVPSGAHAGAVMEWGGKTRRGKNVLPLVLSGSEQNVFATVSGATISVKNTSTKNCYPQTEWFELPAGTYCAVQSDKNIETYLQLASGDYSHTLKGSGYIVFTLDATTPVRYMLSVGTGINFSMAIQTVRGSTPDYDFEAYTPELLSALVDEVRVRGKNLANVDAAVIQGGSNVSIAGNDIIIKADSSVKIPLTLAVGAVVSVSFGVAADFSNAEVQFLLGNGKKIILWGVYTGAVGDSKKTISRTISENVVAICMQSWNTARNVKFSDLQVELFDTPTAYSPYHEDISPIPSAVKALPGYGWSAGNVANTVERTENGWQYVQRVGRVDLGTLSWEYSASKLLFSANIDGAVDTGNTGYTKLECAVLMPGKAFWGNTTDGDGEITINHGIAVARKMAYDNVEDFTSYVSGHPLYYELATPITTDITALMGDSLAPFPVEAGGSITMHHPKADEGFAINVPAKIQYITKLSEVSANG